MFDAALENKDLNPRAVLFPPVILHCKALPPTDVLYAPVVVLSRAQAPTAVLFEATVLLNAPCPTAVFLAPIEHCKVP